MSYAESKYADRIVRPGVDPLTSGNARIRLMKQLIRSLEKFELDAKLSLEPVEISASVLFAVAQQAVAHVLDGRESISHTKEKRNGQS